MWHSLYLCLSLTFFVKMYFKFLLLNCYYILYLICSFFIWDIFLISGDLKSNSVLQLFTIFCCLMKTTKISDRNQINLKLEIKQPETGRDVVTQNLRLSYSAYEEHWCMSLELLIRFTHSHACHQLLLFDTWMSLLYAAHRGFQNGIYMVWPSQTISWKTKHINSGFHIILLTQSN